MLNLVQVAVLPSISYSSSREVTHLCRWCYLSSRFGPWKYRWCCPPPHLASCAGASTANAPWSGTWTYLPRSDLRWGSASTENAILRCSNTSAWLVLDNASSTRAHDTYSLDSVLGSRLMYTKLCRLFSKTISFSARSELLLSNLIEFWEHWHFSHPSVSFFVSFSSGILPVSRRSDFVETENK